jgi:uncharacterized protein (TIGR02266 family)
MSASTDVASPLQRSGKQMSKKHKKQRAKTSNPPVRLQSGTSLRAVVPPSAGAKVLELKRASAPELVAAAPVAAAPVAAAPVAAEPAEQRAAPRVSVTVDIHWWSDSHFYSDLSGDISEGGLFLSTYRPLEVGTLVDVEFSLPETERTILARGQVRWIREHSAELPRGVGIRFERVSDEDREAIHEFCGARPSLYYDDIE